VRRAAKIGYRGIVMIAEPASAVRGSAAWALAADNPGYRLKHFADPYWNPLWEGCQDLDLTVHWHANAGLRVLAPIWKGYSPDQVWAAVVPPAFSALSQFIPLLVFSGILDRYPRLRWASAETGVGWLNYVLDACDHEWERAPLVDRRDRDPSQRALAAEFLRHVVVRDRGNQRMPPVAVQHHVGVGLPA
jgi:hypothetical protein